jgi:hypothetical protein
MSERGWDVDLRMGEAAEEAFVHTFLRAKVEVKYDLKCQETDNICIEYKQRSKSGGEEASGIAVTTAHWWAIKFHPRRWLVIETDELKALARQARQEGHTRPTGDNGNVSVLVPIRRFFESEAETIGRDEFGGGSA